MKCHSPSFVLEPPFEVGLTQNPVRVETLSIACHVGPHVGFPIHSSFIVPLGPQALV